ncbi:hypothetical protein N7512_004987 [Penicillium capsulatum]|nr:hypothetical protein N7512_004987 [Penicillium capsulatum]
MFCCIAKDSDSESETEPLLSGSGNNGQYGTGSDSVQPTIEDQIKTGSFRSPTEGLPSFPGVNDLVRLIKAHGVAGTTQASVFYNDRSPKDDHFTLLQAENWAKEYMEANHLTYAMQSQVYPQKWYDEIRGAMNLAIKKAGL